MNSINGGVLQAYVVAEEGDTRPRIIGEQSSVLKWTKAVVRRVKELFTKKVQFFIDHNDDNSTVNRNPVGEVVASLVKEVAGKMSTIVIGHFPKKELVENMDVCSIEADVEVAANSFVDDVKNITAIALGSSDKDSPAFPGAKRLAVLQCFDRDEGGDKNKNQPGEGDKDMAITFEEIKKGIRDMNIMPWQVYTEDDIKNDRNFGEVFTRAKALEDENTKLKSSYEELEKKNKDILKQSNAVDAKDRLAKMLPSTLTEKQKAFIKQKFNPESIEDLSEDGLKSFVENATKEYSDVAKILGVAEDTNTNDSTDKASAGGDAADPVDEALTAIVKGE